MSSLHPPYPITAFSAVNGLGRSTAEVFAALDAGERGLGPSPLEVTMETVVGAVPGPLAPLRDDLSPYDCRLARVGWMAFEEVREPMLEAISRYGADRVAIILGTSTGGLEETEQAYRAWLESGQIPPTYRYQLQHNFCAFADLLAREVGATGPVYVISSACSSSGKVAASAARLLKAGVIDAALVGGIDSLTRMTLQGFHSLGVLSANPCRPFSAERDGINIGEGAAFFLIEREGDAPVHLLGAGESSDAYRMSSPEPSGRGAREAMARALEAASLSPESVDVVYAHGTATKLNDAAEALAIEAVFGRETPVVSTKGHTGHLLGGAGATGVVFALHSVLSGVIPATLGCDPVDPDVHVAVRGVARARPCRRAISNAFAFGGSNVSVLVGVP